MKKSEVVSIIESDNGEEITIEFNHDNIAINIAPYIARELYSELKKLLRKRNKDGALKMLSEDKELTKELGIKIKGNKQSPIYFCSIEITENNYKNMSWGNKEDVGQYVLYITTRDYWKKKHCQIDHSPEWLTKILQEIEFPGEDTEMSFTADEKLLSKIKNDQRFYEDPDFCQFIYTCGDNCS